MYQPLNESKMDSEAIQNIFKFILTGDYSLIDKILADTKLKRGEGNKRERSYSSIAKEASNLIAIFPVLTSDHIKAESARLCSKYIEQLGVKFLMLALQSHNIDTATDGIDYLKKFHRNLDSSISGNAQAISKTIDGYHNYTQDVKESAIVDFKASPREIKEIMELIAYNENTEVYDTQLNPVSINDFVVEESAGDYHIRLTYVNEVKIDPNNPREVNRHFPKKDNISPLSDQDVKKINDAIPTLLKIKFYTRNSKDDVNDIATEFIIGVKGRLVLASSDEILRRIVNNNKDGKKFIALMRVLTKEITPFDVIKGCFANIRDDALSAKKKGAYGDTWELLRNRAYASKQAVRTGKRNDYSAITTVAISKMDAEDLMIEENIDITNVSIAKRFMDAYNIMAFAIMDDENEVMDIMLDDGSNSFERISYTMLLRQANNETDKMLSLIAANMK